VQTSGYQTSVFEESPLDAKYLHKLLNFQDTMWSWNNMPHCLRSPNFATDQGSNVTFQLYQQIHKRLYSETWQNQRSKMSYKLDGPLLTGSWRQSLLCSQILNWINKIGSNLYSRSASFFGDEIKSTSVITMFFLLEYENANAVFSLQAFKWWSVIHSPCDVTSNSDSGWSLQLQMLKGR